MSPLRFLALACLLSSATFTGTAGELPWFQHSLVGMEVGPTGARFTIESSRPLKRAEALDKTTILKRRGSHVEATVNDIHEVLLLRY